MTPIGFCFTTLFLAFLCPQQITAVDFKVDLPDIRGQNLTTNKYAVKVKECYLKDKTNFEACLLTFWKEVSPLLKKGVPELNIPQMDPLFIDSITFNEKGSTVAVDAKFTNIKIIGGSGIIPKSVKVDRKAKTVKIDVSFPYLNASGNYETKGTILLLPIEGKGDFEMNMTDINAIMTAHITQKGTTVKTHKLDIDFDIKKIVSKLDGLLGGDDVGTAINNMLNDNSQQILADVKGPISKHISQAFLNMTADAFVDMPPDAFIS